MAHASETIFALKPVTFRYKQQIDPTRRSHFGLVAEDVEKVNPDLVVRDKEGKPYSVRYDQVNAMVLNEFLKEHRKVEKLQVKIAELQSTLASQGQKFEITTTKQQNEIEALAASVQKVGEQLEDTIVEGKRNRHQVKPQRARIIVTNQPLACGAPRASHNAT